MGYDRVHYITRDQQNAIRRVVLVEWKPIGESANEIVNRLERQLDADWISEYLIWHSKPEENQDGW